MERTLVKTVIAEDVLSANDSIARSNREQLDRAGIHAVNLMSSPGSGKTTLLERTFERIDGRLRLAVLEGDVQTSLDADRLQRFGAPVMLINTDVGFGGACHLDANMVRYGLAALPLHAIDTLIIENVGNLICPADFKVGEDSKVVVSSVAEGEDKPLKYPLMFRAADLVVINKIDLLPHLDFDLPLFLRRIDAVNPGVARILLSARTGEGVEEWCAWLLAQRAASVR